MFYKINEPGIRHFFTTQTADVSAESTKELVPEYTSCIKKGGDCMVILRTCVGIFLMCIIILILFIFWQ